jgi:hypothetical protein
MHGHYFVGTELFKSNNTDSEEIMPSFETISVYKDLAETTESAEVLSILQTISVCIFTASLQTIMQFSFGK